MPKTKISVSKTKEEQNSTTSNEANSVVRNNSTPPVRKKKISKHTQAKRRRSSRLSAKKRESYSKKKHSSSEINLLSIINQADPKEQAIRQNILVAILSKDMDSIPKLIEELQNYTTIDFVDGKDKSTLLHRCVIQGGTLPIIKILLDKGAYIDSSDIYGRTPLHIASSKGDVEILTFLLDNGANPMAKNIETQTPLHEAAFGGHLNCIKILYEHHVLINLQDINGYTALHISVKRNHILCVEFFIEHGANVLSYTKDDPPKRPIDLIETRKDPKHPNKIIPTNSGKTIYRILKKAGGNKLISISDSKSKIGGGILRSRSIDHKKLLSRKATKMKSPLAFNGIDKSKNDNIKEGPIKYERSKEILETTEKNIKNKEIKEEKEESTKIESPKQELSENSIKVDRRGFIFDESNPAPQTPINTKVYKKNIQKNEQRALKWINIIQSSESIENMKKNKKILKLCDQGIPDTVRGQVWTYISGITTRDNNIYYDLLKEQKWDKEIRDQIYRDINRTMPRHILFQEKGQGQTMLTNVLLAYSSYRPDIGYCQGMGFITAMFLMYMPEEDAFWLLDQVGGDTYGFGPLWEERMIFLKQCMATFEQLLESKYPEIMNVFNDNGIPIQAFSSQFFITGYMYNLPFDIAARVWDAMWLRKFDFLYAVGLAIMKISRNILLNLKMEGLMSFFQFKEGCVPFTADQLVDVSVSTFYKLNFNVIRKIESKFKESIHAENKLLDDRKKKLESLQEERDKRLEEKKNEIIEDTLIETGTEQSIHPTDTNDTFAQISDNLRDNTRTSDEFSALTTEEISEIDNNSSKTKKNRKKRRVKVSRNGTSDEPSEGIRSFVRNLTHKEPKI